MIIDKVCIHRFRPFCEPVEVDMGRISTIVGRNDTGKSCILYALNVFFGKEKLKPSDFHKACEPDQNVVIEVLFNPSNDDVRDRLASWWLLTQYGQLHLKREYGVDGKPITSLCVYDFVDERFQNLHSRRESYLNSLGREVGVEFVKAGRGYTNLEKTEALRQYALTKGVPKADAWVEPDRDTLNQIEPWLPEYSLFKANTDLAVDKAAFQSQFTPLVEMAMEESADLRTEVEDQVASVLQDEVDDILRLMQRHTTAVPSITVKPDLAWKKMVTFDIDTEDAAGFDIPLSQRGVGCQRLFMVAYFEYLAEQARRGDKIRPLILAIEEPEAFLHPAAQRSLLDSFYALAEEGYQIILTSHSPVFAGAVEASDLVLMFLEDSRIKVQQGASLDLDEVANELGVLPSDQITTYSAIVFVEGKRDVIFLEEVARTLRRAGYIEDTFASRDIGIVPTGGTTLKFHVEKNTMRRLNRRFGILVDRDTDAYEDPIPSEKCELQKQCEAEGGIFHIWNKREIENYLHPEVFERKYGKILPFGDYDDVWKLAGRQGIPLRPHFREIVREMRPEEIVERGDYVDQSGQPRNEILEVMQRFLGLPEH